MKEKIKKVYYCDHCGKHYIHKGWAKYHEKWCSKNPRFKRPCTNCIHLKGAKTEIYFDENEYGYPDSMTVKSLICDKTKQLMYHPRVERFWWFKQNGCAEDQEPMPTVCNGMESRECDHIVARELLEKLPF